MGKNKTIIFTELVTNMDIDRKRMKKAGLFLLIVLGIYFVFFHHAKKPPPVSAGVVIVQKPVPAKISSYVTQTGTTVAFNSVNLVGRIEGYLDKIEFVDGSFVKKGQELFIIEPEPYLEKLRGAQASVAAAKAAYEYAKAEHARQEKMYKENATSLNNVEKWLAQQEEAEANVAGAVANAEIAAINYSYTHVVAPFDGRIGRHLVDPGNLVGNGKATDLATVEQIDPIYVYFNLSELDLIRVRAAAHAEGMKPSDINTVPVYVAMQNEIGFPHEGKLDFVNTGLNASTGTMEFRALLANKDYALLPGLFVQVRIPISQPSMKLTVPDVSVLYDQIGPYLLVVDQDNTVRLKRVKLGSVQQGVRAILKGINANNRVIVDGLQNATPDHVVTVKERIP
jgi:RND family efflux transporter MFP subunit